MRRIPSPTRTTENQAIGVFRDTDSRSYLMAGRIRLANAAAGSCQTLVPGRRRGPQRRQRCHATNAELT